MKDKYLKWAIFAISLFIICLIASAWSISTGEIHFKLGSLFGIIREADSMEYEILKNIRIPRLLLAFSIGGALSLSGAVLQGIYRNPLVEPYTLGISGGAALGVAAIVVTGLQMSIGAFILPLAGFLGALATIFLVYFLSMRKGGIEINRMLLIGVMISFVASSAMMFFMAVTSVENMHGIVFWMMGSLDEPNINLIYIMLSISLLGLVTTYFFARPLNALRLGETKALHLGINTSFTIKILFLTCSLLAGASVAVAGVIGFVGLVIPHFIRMIIGSDYRVMLIGSFLGGSIFLIICDVIARTIIAPHELPIGVITGIFGGIGFIIVLSRMSKKNKAF